MIEAENLSVTYHGAETSTLAGIHLRVQGGEFVLVTGPTGSGKSTLLNCLNGVIQHESSAAMEGAVTLHNEDLRNIPLPEICRRIGTVFQNPDSQICTATPETEIAFGLENIGLARAEMEQRIEKALEQTGLKECRYQPAHTLSGGQKQRLMIACALALQPELLLLDEPISQLDPQSAAEILETISALKRSHRLAVIMVEHRMEETVPLADRIVLLDRGRIVLDQSRDAALSSLERFREIGLNVPHLPDLFEKLGRPERPLRPEEAPVVQLCAQGDFRGEPATTTHAGCPVHHVDGRPPIALRGGPVCEIHELAFAYNSRSQPIFEGLNLVFYHGERIALMGSNGAGKTTLLHLLAGLLAPVSGAIRWHAEKRPAVGLMLQSPDLMLFCETVREEIAFAPLHARLPREETDRIVTQMLEQMGIKELADRAPFALSRGQRLRTALASILSKRPSVLLLDEPTTGQDREQIERMMTPLEERFDLLIFCTHDVDTAAHHATRVILMDDGRIIADGRPADVLFDDDALAKASVRQTSLQAYARRLGTRALGVDELMDMLSRDG